MKPTTRQVNAMYNAYVTNRRRRKRRLAAQA